MFWHLKIKSADDLYYVFISLRKVGVWTQSTWKQKVLLKACRSPMIQLKEVLNSLMIFWNQQSNFSSSTFFIGLTEFIYWVLWDFCSYFQYSKLALMVTKLWLFYMQKRRKLSKNTPSCWSRQEAGAKPKANLKKKFIFRRGVCWRKHLVLNENKMCMICLQIFIED